MKQNNNSSIAPEEERRLWEKMSEGDEDARERLILLYRPMVFWMAKKFRVQYGSYQDLLQEGMIALITAADNFDVTRSNSFSTYAYYRIHGRMVNFLQRSESRAPVPVEDEYLERDESFSEILDMQEWRLVIEDGFNQLQERERDVVHSLMMEGRRAAEVADEQGVGVSHVYRLQRRAIAKLKSFIFPRDATSEV